MAKPDLDGEMIRGSLEMLILSVLARGDRHGYAICADIAAMSEQSVVIGESSLYPALHRLERDGLTVAEWRYTEHHRRAKFYTITEQGRHYLDSRVAVWNMFAGAVGRIIGSTPQGNPA